MTIKATIKAINALPNMRSTYKAEYKEFKVWRGDLGHDTDYFTSNREDALGTARKMSEYCGAV